MNIYTADSKLLKLNGRGKVENGEFPMFTTGSGVEFIAHGSTAYVNLEAGFDTSEPWVSVLIDGERITRTALERGDNRILLFRNLDPASKKHIRITKDVQSMPDDNGHFLVFKSLEIEGNIEKPAEKSRKIEFIGDSITSGEGILGAKDFMDWVPLCFDSVFNYSNLIAKNLDADYRVISQSGWGVGCGWNNDPTCTLPRIYEQTCGTCNALKDRFDSLSKNDFASWQPDLIVVNLGTNDCGSLSQPEFTVEATGERFKNSKKPDGSIEELTSKRFENNCLNFLKMLRANNPKARILWVFGILGYDLKAEIERAIETFNMEDSVKAEFLQFPMMTDDQAGSRQHPGVPAHKMMADIITEHEKRPETM